MVYSKGQKQRGFSGQSILKDILLARIEDQGMGSEKWGVYYLKVYDENQKILKDLKFNFIQFVEHHWMLSGQSRFNEIYYGNQYILSKKPRRKIKWEAGGVSGPSTTQQLSF